MIHSSFWLAIDNDATRSPSSCLNSELASLPPSDTTDEVSYRRSNNCKQDHSIFYVLVTTTCKRHQHTNFQRQFWFLVAWFCAAIFSVQKCGCEGACFESNPQKHVLHEKKLLELQKPSIRKRVAGRFLILSPFPNEIRMEWQMYYARGNYWGDLPCHNLCGVSQIPSQVSLYQCDWWLRYLIFVENKVRGILLPGRCAFRRI